ncbi:hypothetical protein PT974_03200 [Cladobotryum mycophilum]|uniref:Heparan-alpha-glucosaminide N-acetyltransferase catalytic domain-containing protein n=1 Tax=Cladobotryum mycophilum TaxID=491253 RepID=A0ABR0SSR5_9HYPO
MSHLRNSLEDPIVCLTSEPSENGYRYASSPALGSNFDRPRRPSQVETSAITRPSVRILAPDLLRGLLMTLMALDHVALGLHTWELGTNRTGESDGVIVKRWNDTAAYVIRTLTHLCAPGFVFLLGMGVVFLSQSRTKLGWSAWRLLWYYTLRAVILTLVTVLLGLIGSYGNIWFLNLILFALAVDYLLAGVLWLLMSKTEEALARGIACLFIMHDKRVTARAYENEDDDEEEGSESQSLLRRGDDNRREDEWRSLAASTSWHIHNLLLLVLSLVSIFWNIWLSPTHGHCKAQTSDDSPNIPIIASTKIPKNLLLRIWFWPVKADRIMSAKRWNSAAMAAGHLSASLLFAVVFVSTRLFHFGNLSENCLHTPDQERNRSRNPYLASPASFFYIVKYPPDVPFWAFCMSANLLILALFTATPTRIAKRLTVLLDFGTSALFFYVIHLLLALSFLAGLLKSWFGNKTGIPDPLNPDSTKGVTNLYGYFAAWLGVLVIMWPLCRLYSRFKSTKNADSLWRLF